MNNPFHDLEKTIANETIDSAEIVRALMVTIYLECCDGCGSKLRSQEFIQSFERMIQDMKLCHSLRSKNAA
jgi:hypothetical protein